VITRATVRVRSLPETERFEAAVLRDWGQGTQLVRALAQARVPVSMLRLSDAEETRANLHLASHPNAMALARRALELAGYGPGNCLLVYGVTGAAREVAHTRRTVQEAVRAHGGLPVPYAGKVWSRARFRTPYLRNTLWERGYALDTLETAVPWARVATLAATLRGVLQTGLQAEGERVLVLVHLSHVYPDGASIYVTYAFRRGGDPAATLERWEKLKRAASLIIVAQRGTISHQHGVGVDHAPYLIAEQGAPGTLATAAALRALDPYGIMNPGKLISS
jgi:alkyldihydroxyacetonephosphate synthase